MNDDNLIEDAPRIKDGIEMCEDKCRCGGSLRLHTHTFRPKEKPPAVKHYIDCDKHCGCVTEWHNSVDEALEAFDNEFKLVSESTQV